MSDASVYVSDMLAWALGQSKHQGAKLPQYHARDINICSQLKLGLLSPSKYRDAWMACAREETKWSDF